MSFGRPHPVVGKHCQHRAPADGRTSGTAGRPSCSSLFCVATNAREARLRGGKLNISWRRAWSAAAPSSRRVVGVAADDPVQDHDVGRLDPGRDRRRCRAMRRVDRPVDARPRLASRRRVLPRSSARARGWWQSPHPGWSSSSRISPTPAADLQHRRISHAVSGEQARPCGGPSGPSPSSDSGRPSACANRSSNIRSQPRGSQQPAMAGTIPPAYPGRTRTSSTVSVRLVHPDRDDERRRRR